MARTNLLKRIIRVCTNPSNFIYSVSQRIEGIYYRLHGLDFSMEHKWDAEGHSNYSQPTIQTRRVLRKYLAETITNDDAIIDIGCGKGSMLYLFSQYPFKLVGGLEYSGELVAIAERNLAILRKLHSWGGGITIVQGDASLYTDYDNYNYFYLFNPFNANIMTPFLHNLKENVHSNPRRIHVIYLHPELHSLFIAEGFKVERELHMFTYPRECTIYSYES